MGFFRRRRSEAEITHALMAMNKSYVQSLLTLTALHNSGLRESLDEALQAKAALALEARLQPKKRARTHDRLANQLELLAATRKRALQRRSRLPLK